MNAFRHLLKAAGSHPPVGTWIMSANAIVAEAIGHAGFDWGVIDMEHTPLDTMGVVHMLQALAATKMVPVVRVPWNDAVVVKRVLDAGATTVIFPFVQDGEEARRAVAATRYAPQGIRGVAPGTRASRYGTAYNYFKTANDNMGVIVQIETPAALERLEEIASVPGVDAIFVGPGDLSASMGFLGEPTHPQVMDACAKAAQRARKLGMPIGTVGGTPDVVAQYRAMGFNFVAISSDLGLLMRAAAAALSALRTQDTDIVHSVTAGTFTGTRGTKGDT